MKKKKLDIIYEDKSILVINKPTHLLTISDNKNSPNLYYEVYDYLHKKNQKVFIVHRLDKDTSGVILFAKSEDVKRNLQDTWDNTTREYVTVVEGKLENKKGVVKEYLTEDKTLHTYSTDKKHGKLAITEYEVIDEDKNFSILKINIKTGRKNQIRVAMQDINHPIVGDKKYGSTKNPLRRVCLHATKLVIIHPKTKEILEFNSNIPKEFDFFYKNKRN